ILNWNTSDSVVVRPIQVALSQWLDKSVRIKVRLLGQRENELTTALTKILVSNESDPIAKQGQVSKGEKNIPSEFVLEQNYPNPFNPVTTIRYALPENAYVTLRVYDILGREIATLVNGYEDAGYKEIVFDASALPSGVYIYRLIAGEHRDMKKMLLMK
ncbi:MAG: T9SS type A sorting domain-containing protein, partial [Bacteroidota bacterium]